MSRDVYGIKEDFIRQNIMNILDGAPDEGLLAIDIFRKIYPDKNRYSYEYQRVAGALNQFKKTGAVFAKGTRGKFHYCLNKNYTFEPKSKLRFNEYLKVEAILSFLAGNGPATLSEISKALVKDCGVDDDELNCDGEADDNKCIDNSYSFISHTSTRLSRLTEKGILMRKGPKGKYTYEISRPKRKTIKSSLETNE